MPDSHSAFVFRGTATGLGSTAAQTYLSAAPGYIAPLGRRGDVDSDGYLDFAITHSNGMPEPQPARFCRGGSPLPTSPTAAWMLVGGGSFAR